MIRIVETLVKTKLQSTKLGDAMVAIPRIICGLLLAFDFGSSKFGVPWSSNDLPFLGIPEWFVQDVATFGGIFALTPYFFAWIAAASETIGGLMLALGLKTRVASFLIMSTMFGAIFLQQWGNGMWNMLPAAGFLWVSMHSLAMGSGRFGFDYIIAKVVQRKRLIHTPIDQITPSIPKVLSIILIAASTLGTHSAIAQERTIKISVDMNQVTEVNTVGVKGSISPLSSDKVFPLSDENKDGIYEAEITFNTPARYVRFKFVNGNEIELEGSDRRILWFKDEIVSKAYVFNEFQYYSADQISGLAYTENQIKEDIEVLRKTIEYIHPAVYKYRDSIDLQQDFEVLEKEMIAQPNVVNVFKSVSKFAAKIKCSHTFTNPWNQGPDIKQAIFHQPDKLPLTFKRIGKRLFIDKNASENNSVMRGDEILSINGVETNVILTTLAQYVTSDGNNYEKKLERLSLTGNEKFSLFDIFYPIEFGSTDEFQLTLKSFQTKEAFQETVKAISKTNRTKKLSERYPDVETSLRDGWNFSILNDKTGILSINSFAVQRNEFNWKQLIDEAFEELNNKAIPNLIIDIRENEGGQGEVGEYILERIMKTSFKAPAMKSSVRYLSIPEQFKKYISTWAKFPYDFNGKIDSIDGDSYVLKEKYSVAGKTYKPKKNGYKGKVFLLTSAANSSATHLMAAYAKQMNDVTLVGQETGGNQLGTNGSFIFFLRLPNSRIEIDIPVINMYVPPVSGEAKDAGIKPHIYVEKNWEDLANGVDTELQAVLELIGK
ncbi:MAG: S41 family peptidase [Ekhidna sp.]